MPDYILNYIPPLAACKYFQMQRICQIEQKMNQKSQQYSTYIIKLQPATSNLDSLQLHNLFSSFKILKSTV
jgi:hypothetical protein